MGSNSGKVGLVDTRESNTKCVEMFRVFSDSSAKTVDVHPLRRELFLCPSNRGECAIFDLRAANESGGGGLLKPALEFQGHARSRISCAFFSPETGKNICTVADDNQVVTDQGLLQRIETLHLFFLQLRLYGSESGGFPYKSVAHNNETGRSLTAFKAEWHPGRDDVFFVGSMGWFRQIEAFSDRGAALPSLRGNHLSSVCSVVKCHPSRDVVVGGDSAGKIHVFK